MRLGVLVLGGRSMLGRMVGSKERGRLEKVGVVEGDVFGACGAPLPEKRLVDLPVSGAMINTLSFGNPEKKHVVLLPGWGAGAAVFAKNVGPLAKEYRVHVVDWLGTGGSSRPKFNRKASVQDAEKFFVEALREWTNEFQKFEKSFDRFLLVGHSLGGYLSSVYSMQYPERVDKLVLVSPVGVPRRPPENPRAKRSVGTRALIFMFRGLWDANISPQSVVRPLGRRTMTWLCKGYARHRFPTLTEPEAEVMGKYFAEISLLPGSGEYALNTILEFGAWARDPLFDRLPEVNVPISFVYGDHDWMDWRAAVELRPSLQKYGETPLEIVEDAGHFLFVDNPDGFNQWLLKDLAKTRVAVN